jgi:acyl-CoA synthetase (AMP-forming)/AMP-acid ligase II
MLVSDYLIASAEREPEKNALLYGSRSVTYIELLATSKKIASWLDEFHFEPGFRGAILSDDAFEYVTAYFGILMAGGVVVGLNTQTSDAGLAYVLNDCGASVLFTSNKFNRYLRNVLPQVPLIRALTLCKMEEQDSVLESCVRQDLAELHHRPCTTSSPQSCRSFRDFAQIIYTSGTTGKPKGVVLRHANLIANTESIVSYLQLQANDKVMAVLPFFYSYGNSVLLTHLAVGGALVVNQSFLYPNVILQQMAEQEVTGFSGVPSTFAILLYRSALASYSFPALRYITQAGAAMSPELARRLNQVFPTAKIYIMYGQTEASARLSYLDPAELVQRPGSIGKSIPGVELTLRDRMGRVVKPGETGEIVARGENIMAGYWNRPEETNEVLRPEGLWTGDLARSDEDGFLYIVSRKSDLIKCGSHRIGPKEIEDVLAEHSAVHEAAVIGIPDELLDERIRACVVLRSDANCSAKDLLVFCRKHLPLYKVPHEVVFMEDLPRTTTGKIKKIELHPMRSSC